MLFIWYTLSIPEVDLKGVPHNKELRLKTLLSAISSEQPIGFNALLAKRIVSKRLLANYLDELEKFGLIRKDSDAKYVLTVLGLTRIAVPDLENLQLKLEQIHSPFEPMPNWHYINRMEDYPTPIDFDIIRSMTEEENASLEYWTNFLQHEDFLSTETAYEESAKGFAYFAKEYFNNVFYERMGTLARQSEDGIKSFTLENLLDESLVLILSYKPAMETRDKDRLRHGVIGFYLISLLNYHTADNDLVIREMIKSQILDKEEGRQVLNWLGFTYNVGKKHKVRSRVWSSSLWELHKQDVYRLALRHLSLANLVDNKLKLFLVVPELVCLCQRTCKPRGAIALDLPEILSVIAGIQERNIMNDEWMQAKTNSMYYQDIVSKCNEAYGLTKDSVDKQLEILEHWGIVRKEEVKFQSTIAVKFRLDIAARYPLVASGIELKSYVEDLMRAFEKRKKLTERQAKKIVESPPEIHIEEI